MHKCIFWHISCQCDAKNGIGSIKFSWKTGRRQSIRSARSIFDNETILLHQDYVTYRAGIRVRQDCTGTGPVLVLGPWPVQVFMASTRFDDGRNADPPWNAQPPYTTIWPDPTIRVGMGWWGMGCWGCIGLYWAVLGCIWQYWAVLASIWRYWPVFDGNGQ